MQTPRRVQQAGGPSPAHKTGWSSCRRGGIDAHSAPNPHPESQDCFPLAASTATRRHLGILLCDRTAMTLNHDTCPRRKLKLGPSLLIAGSELPVEELSSNLNASPVVRSVFWRGITPHSYRPGICLAFGRWALRRFCFDSVGPPEYLAA